MSRASSSGPLVHSIWDRLLGAASRPANLNPAADLAAVRAEVCRDLERLLNTRRAYHDHDLRAPQLERSLLAYGIPELSSFNPDSPSDRARLTRIIKTAVERFEPRLQNVHVDYRPGDQNRHHPRINLRIQAQLQLEALSGPVEFDTQLDLGNSTFAVNK